MSRGYSAIGLHQPKCNANVGSVIRACTVYDVSLLVASGRRYSKSATDTTVGYNHFPFLHNVNDLQEYIPYAAVPVAVDIVPGARNLFDYVHPERAFYIFGPEDGTLGSSITSWCRDVVYVPTKHCMNLAATVNVVLYDRAAKQHRYRKSRDNIEVGFEFS